MEPSQISPIYYLETLQNNSVFIMRDDLIPYSFGGNKVRKAMLFFNEIERGDYDTVVTYGSGGSNHCRVVCNMAAARGMKSYIVTTEQESHSLNRKMVDLFGTVIISCGVEHVADTIDCLLDELQNNGKKPYFIPGGGHGNIGTKAYDLAYDEIKKYESISKQYFDYIFFASGTGTTQAGLVCGAERYADSKKIVGISIARRNPRGGNVVTDSVKDYLGYCPEDRVCFVDSYIGEGYGKYHAGISQTIQRIFTKYGVPMDSTYTGKAYWGMEQYIYEHAITGKNILFIHTGGTPIFCDWLEEQK